MSEVARVEVEFNQYKSDWMNRCFDNVCFIVIELAWYPGVPIPIWSRGEEERLVYTVVRMSFISNQLLKRRKSMIYSMLVTCLLDMTVSSTHTITLIIHEESQVWWQILLPNLLVDIRICLVREMLLSYTCTSSVLP